MGWMLEQHEIPRTSLAGNENCTGVRNTDPLIKGVQVPNVNANFVQ